MTALQSIGWRMKRQSGSHRTLEHDDYPDHVFTFHDGEEIGPGMLARIAKKLVLNQATCEADLDSANNCISLSHRQIMPGNRHGTMRPGDGKRRKNLLNKKTLNPACEIWAALKSRWHPFHPSGSAGWAAGQVVGQVSNAMPMCSATMNTIVNSCAHCDQGKANVILD